MAGDVIEQLPSVGLGANFDPTDFDLHDLCRELQLDLDLLNLKLVLPINVDIQFTYNGIPNPGDVTGKLLGALNTALAPLTPLFDLVDLVLILEEVFEAIATLNPFKIKVALGKLTVYFPKLAKLIPQLSLPRTIKSFVRVLIVLLKSIRADILLILAEQSRINLAGARATALGNLDLEVAVGCMQVDLNAQVDLTRKNAEPINRLINTINVFCKLAKLDPIPALEIGPDMAGAVAPLTTSIKVLEELDAALVVPL